MKNILNHNGTSQLLLANVDDGTNRIFINGEELDPTYWVGEHTYVVLIDGTPIGIRQISSNSGNIMMRKVPDSVNEYQLVRQSDALCYSHVGQIIESTTLATLEDVQAIYGSDTTWIQHTGYVLRGASSGVVEKQAQNDGGADSVTVSSVASHNHTQNAHNHTQNAHGHTVTSVHGQIATDYSGSTSTSTRMAPTSYTSVGNYIYAANTTATNIANTATNIANGANYTVNTLPKYKNVYIWERTA